MRQAEKVREQVRSVKCWGCKGRPQQKNATVANSQEQCGLCTVIHGRLLLACTEGQHHMVPARFTLLSN